MSREGWGNGRGEAWNVRLLGHSDLNGYGDGMQLMLKDSFLYVGHVSKMGLSIVDVSDPSRPRVVRQIKNPPGTHTPKVQIAGNLLLRNYEQYGSDKPERVGLQILDISDPVNPKEVGFFSTGGKGVHRMWYTGGRYAYMSAVPDGFVDRILLIVDLSDPAHPREVGKWWWPGMWQAGGEQPTWPEGLRYSVHHPIVSRDRAYVGFWDGGLVILDISDPHTPRLVSHLSWAPEEGGCTHTALPLPARNLLVVTDEATKPECQEGPRRVRVVDISDETRPRVISLLPEPEGDFCRRGLRFGPHNLHENRPGSFVSDRLVFVTYFNAGLRVYDITDPEAPREVAYYIPPTPPGQKAPQINDVFVSEEGIVYVSDRVNGGIYILQLDIDLSQ